MQIEVILFSTHQPNSSLEEIHHLMFCALRSPNSHKKTSQSNDWEENCPETILCFFRKKNIPLITKGLEG